MAGPARVPAALNHRPPAHPSIHRWPLPLALPLPLPPPLQVSTVLGVAVPSERASSAWSEGVAIWVAVAVVSLVGECVHESGRAADVVMMLLLLRMHPPCLCLALFADSCVLRAGALFIPCCCDEWSCRWLTALT